MSDVRCAPSILLQIRLHSSKNNSTDELKEREKNFFCIKNEAFECKPAFVKRRLFLISLFAAQLDSDAVIWK